MSTARFPFSVLHLRQAGPRPVAGFQAAAAGAAPCSRSPALVSLIFALSGFVLTRGAACAQCAGDRFWVGAVKEHPVGSPTGVRAKIECRDVKLCNEASNTPPAHSVAHCSVAASSGCGAVWAEVGWTRTNHGDWNQPPWARRVTFAALGFPKTQQPCVLDILVRHTTVDPGNGAKNDYCAVKRDLASGTWTFSLPGGPFDLTRSEWEGKTGQNAAWEGEIRGFETDMPGTQKDPCEFNICRFGTGFGNQWPLADPDSWKNSLPNEWAYCPHTPQRFEIYDLKPLP